jgi:hypothetical protein
MTLREKITFWREIQLMSFFSEFYYGARPMIEDSCRMGLWDQAERELAEYCEFQEALVTGQLVPIEE